MSLNRNPSRHGLGSAQRTNNNDRRLEVPTDAGLHLPPSYDPRVLDWAADHPGRSWLSEGFIRSLERGAGRHRLKRNVPALGDE